MKSSNELESCDFDPKVRKEIEIIDLIIALVVVGLSIWALLSYSFFKEAVAEQIVFYGKIGLFLITAFLELVPQFLNPYLTILVALGVGINVHAVFIIASLGSILGSLMGFEIGKRYGFRFICPLFKPDTLFKILNFWKKNGKVFVMLAALTPLPYVPLVFGALKMTRRDFWLYGILPRILSFIIVAYGSYLGFFRFSF